MAATELGTLVEAKLREAWSHEAHNFTPWLADHLDQLGSVIGIPLEFEGREVAVDTFSADILARNPLDDSLVLIENQLEGTDHNHLGQIMTYLAGLDTHTIIWVAADFREAHPSALNWLNEHTVEPFAFFAVRVKVVRIGDSPLAPVFEVLSRPNNWERRLQKIAKETRQISDLGQFRFDFWGHYLERHPEDKKHGSAAAVSSMWRSLDDFGLAVTIFVGKKHVGVFIRGPRGADPQAILEHLAPHADRLEEVLGIALKESKNGHFLVQSIDANNSDPSQWDMAADWLFKQANRYEAALKDILGEQG